MGTTTHIALCIDSPHLRRALEECLAYRENLALTILDDADDAADATSPPSATPDLLVGEPSALERFCAQHRDYCHHTDIAALGGGIAAASGMADAPSAAATVIPFPIRIGALLDMAETRAQKRRALAQHRLNLPGGEWLLCLPEKSLHHPGTQRHIFLTPKESLLLEALAAGEAISREALILAAWGEQREGVDTHSFDTHLYRLRNKMEQGGCFPLHISVSPQGYRLTNDLPVVPQE